MPNNSTVTRDGNTFNITGGTQAGSNLFHSFGEFSVPTGGAAIFNNALDIQNIISRVTGKSVSNIDGLIKANGTANLFLINPNGIIFGKDASLNIGGSFVASTASSLKFADGIEFSATAPQTTPLLSISVPIGLQFGTNPGNIQYQSSLETTKGLIVQPGKTLALIGGDVEIKAGFLGTSNGRIELGSVSSNSFVSLTPTFTGYTLGYKGVENFQNILLTQEAIAIVTTNGDSDGSIQMQGANVTLSDGSQINVFTLGEKTGEGLTVNASKSVQVIGESPDGEYPSGFFSRTYGTGRAGSLTINTPVLLVNGAQISTSTSSPGDGGNLTVNASELVQVTGTSKNGEQSGGLYAQARPGATGNAGNLTINTKQLLVQDGAEVSTTTFGSGNGGSLTVNASKGVQVIDTKGNVQLETALFTSTLKTGNAGDLTINTPVLLVQNGALVSASTLDLGKAGSLTVNASKMVQLVGTDINGYPSALFARTTGTGNAGDLTINTPMLLISDGALATVSSTGVGVAGNLGINASSVRLDNGKITAQTRFGNGGNLKLNVADLLLMRRGAQISTTAGTAQAGGDGGSITINAPNGFIIAVPNENSDITANAYTGNGGRVRINASGIYGTQFREKENPLTSDITASSDFGTSGTVELNTPEIDPNSGLVELPTIPVDTQIAQGCYSPGYAQNRFAITGRGGLPPNPKDILTPEAPQIDWVSLKPSNHNRSLPPVTTKPTTSTPKRIVEATGAVLNAKGQIVLSANSSTVSPHGSRQSAIQCHGS